MITTEKTNQRETIEGIIREEGKMILLKKGQTYYPEDFPLVGIVESGVILESVYAKKQRGVLIYSSEVYPFFLQNTDSNPLFELHTHYLSLTPKAKVLVLPYQTPNSQSDFNVLELGLANLLEERLQRIMTKQLINEEPNYIKTLFAIHQLLDPNGPKIQQLVQNQTEVAKVCNIPRENVSVAYKRFREDRIIVPTKGSTSRKTFFNRDFVQRELQEYFHS